MVKTHLLWAHGSARGTLRTGREECYLAETARSALDFSYLATYEQRLPPDSNSPDFDQDFDGEASDRSPL